MHQRTLFGLGHGDQFMEPGREAGMRVGRCQQVGFQADVVEDPVGGKFGRCGRIGSAGCMDARQARRHQRGEVRVGNAIAQLRLPQRVALRRQELHGEMPGGLVESEQSWRGTGDGGVGALHPACLVAIALDRRLPVRGHAQPGESTLDADRSGRKVDAPDVGRNAASETFAVYRHARRRQNPHMFQGSYDLAGRGFA